MIEELIFLELNAAIISSFLKRAVPCSYSEGSNAAFYT